MGTARAVSLIVCIATIGFCYGNEVLPILEWRNGDTLKGAILPSSSAHISWKSKAFLEPFQLDLNQLEKIDFPKPGKNEPQVRHDNSFRLTFQNGDRLFGDLVSVDSRYVVFRSDKFSRDLKVKKYLINRIERIGSSHFRYSGPTELEEWKPLGRNARQEDWYLEDSGDFTTHRWGGELFREIDLPSKVQIAFRIDFPNEQPNIEIGLCEDATNGPRIETWDDTLVLTSGNRFEPIVKLGTDDRAIEFRIFWDREAKVVKVCNADGIVMSQLDQVDYQKGKTKAQVRNSGKRRSSRLGFRLLNRNTCVRFTRLTVIEWDGKTISEFDASKPRIEMNGGQVLVDIQDLQMNRDRRLQLKGESLDFEAMNQWVFATTLTNQRLSSEARLAWTDGSVVSGEFNGVDSDKVFLQPSWLDSNFDAHLSGAKDLHFPRSSQPMEFPPDQLKGEKLSIGGVLTSGFNQSWNTLLSWQPVGSLNASPLADSETVEITREAFPGATDLVGDSRIYLTNDEVIAGKLIAIEPEHIEFSSYLTGRVKISNEHLRAVDIAGAGLLTHGFADKGWKAITAAEGPEEGIRNTLPYAERLLGGNGNKDSDKPDVVINRDRVVMHRGGFGHMNLLVGDRIRFRTHWQPQGGVFTLQLFCSAFDDRSPSTDLLFASQQNGRILVSQLKPGGGFSFSGDVSIKDNVADIEVRATHEAIEVYIDGKRAHKEIKVHPDQISGNGIAFKMGGGWRGWQQDITVEFSDFSVDRTPGYLPKRVINQGAKLSALTIPRFHRENPPKHVLVAPNGDLLRGELLAVKGDQIQFRSRSEEINIPRSRVSAIVWLQPKEPEEEKGGTDLEAAETVKSEELVSDDGEYLINHQLIMHDGTRLNLAARETVDGDFVGESSVLGTCRVPIATMRKIGQGPAHPLARKANSDQVTYADWAIRHTPDPAIPKGDGSETSPMIGKVAPDFSITMLDGGEFTLSNRKGRVVVLDFWATWCGPCIRAMPEIFKVVKAYRGNPIDFVAVNQAETPPIINEFLDNRNWTGAPVALDFQLNVGRKYEVKGIPYTVVVGKDGKIAWVHSGYAQDFSSKLSNAISKALAK